MSHTIIVLFGGLSDERHVSVASAQNIVRVLAPPPFAWFWAPNGVVHDVAVGDLLAHQRPFEIDFVPARPAVFLNIEQALDTLPVDDPVFLLGLHGTGGEDGTLQRMFESRGIAFTGSGSVASAAAFDKARAKELVAGKLRIAESQVANDDDLRDVVNDMLTRHARIVLKPLAGGSSRGLFFLGRGDAIPRIDIPYIVEQFVEGRELTDGVADMGEGPVALPIIAIEIDPGREFDYAGKYLGTGTREVCPAKISDELTREVQDASVTAHELLGCEGYSRTDFVAAADGLYYLETNTLPGLTAASLVPQELAAAGISFRDFLYEQVKLALK